MTAAVMAMRAYDRNPDTEWALGELARYWPVGQPVRHAPSGLQGRVVEAVPEFLVAGCAGAHALLCWRGGRPVDVVAVEIVFDGGFRAVAWYRPPVLRRIAGGA